MKRGLLKLVSAGTSFVTFIRAAAGASANVTFTLPGALPASTNALVVTNTGQIGYQALTGGGTVTSVGLTAPSIFTVAGSPVTTNGALALALANQAPNTLFMGPASGGNAAPTFRGLAYADVSALVGQAANSLAAGNDSRFHSPNTDSGTTQASFQIGSSASGPRLKNATGVLEVRNAGDSAYANLIVANLIVTGTQTINQSETVEYGDAILLLNADYSGAAPTENGGLEVNRGTQPRATVVWNESTDKWIAGAVGATATLTRIVEASFTNASLTAGIFNLTHNLNTLAPSVVVYDNTGELVGPDKVSRLSANEIAIDLTEFGALTGTWNISVIG